MNVFRRHDGWRFVDETGSDSLGPFSSQELAEKALDAYAAEYLEGKESGFTWPKGLKWDSEEEVEK